jgi:hypothetical protein
MELLIPGLAGLLFAVAIAYFVMPMAGPPMLVAVGAVLLLIAEYTHWSQFGVSEYERSTWQNNLRRYGSYIVIAILLVAAYGFYTFNQSGAGTPALPAITTPTIGGGVMDMAKTVSSRIRELMRH